MAKRSPVRIEIEGLSHDGRGLARLDGKVSFVPGALPGETVDAVLRRPHRRFDEYGLIDVVVPAAERIAPPCALVGRCGGCDLQHLAADAQLRHKTEVVLDLLRRQAGLQPEQLEPPLRSPPFGYRRRARLALDIPRRGGVPQVGFREAAGSGVVAVADCPVLVPELAPLPGRIQSTLADLQRPGALGHVELSLSEAADGTTQPVIHVHTVTQPDDRDGAVLERLARLSGAYLSVAAAGSTPVYLHRPRPEGPGYLLPDFDLRIGFQPGDFLQGNGSVNRLLVRRAVDWLGAADGRSVLDAFAGLGNFSLALARRGFRVLGLEADAAMVERARDNARDNGVARTAFAVRDLCAGSPELGFADVAAAVLDPPRSGAHALTSALAARRVPSILYVSCAPPTLARDAALLAAAGYVLERLALVDMFPQTSHIEVLASFGYHGGRGRRRGGRNGGCSSR